LPMAGRGDYVRRPRAENDPTARAKRRKIPCGAVAQLGERYNGIVEVVGSIPSGSTIFIKTIKGLAR
jgi:hypothetical protein